MNETPRSGHVGAERTAQFVRLFSAHSRRIYTYILTLLPNRTDAEDVFQEVSSILWEKFDEFQPGTQFGAWACRIAYFRAMKQREQRRRRPIALSPEFFEAVDAELLAMDDSLDAEYRALADCFAKLSEPDRELILARYRPDGAPRRLAARLGKPIKSIYKALSRIRRALLECVTQTLAERGGA